MEAVRGRAGIEPTQGTAIKLALMAVSLYGHWAINQDRRRGGPFLAEPCL
jgi:hypothetical protein